MTLTPKFKARCETLAMEWRAKFSRRIYDALPADLVLGKLNAKLVTPQEIVGASSEFLERLNQAKDWSAGIVFRKPLTILCNPSHGATRRESDLMHEAGHLLLDHPMVPFSLDNHQPLRDPQHEEEAIYLGGCLQIPRRGLLWATQKGYGILQIAQHFGASEAMARYRVNVTGVEMIPGAD